MIALDGALTAESDGIRISIDGTGSVLTCRVDGGTASFVEIVRRGRQLLPALRVAIPVLVRCGVRMEIVSGNVRIGRAGSGVRPNALARLLRLPHTRVGA